MEASGESVHKCSLAWKQIYFTKFIQNYVISRKLCVYIYFECQLPEKTIQITRKIFFIYNKPRRKLSKNFTVIRHHSRNKDRLVQVSVCFFTFTDTHYFCDVFGFEIFKCFLHKYFFKLFIGDLWKNFPYSCESFLCCFEEKRHTASFLNKPFQKYVQNIMKL